MKTAILAILILAVACGCARTPDVVWMSERHQLNDRENRIECYDLGFCADGSVIWRKLP